MSLNPPVATTSGLLTMMTDGLISIAEAQGNAAAIESMATLLNELATLLAHGAGATGSPRC
jgi:hypothetical protein